MEREKFFTTIANQLHNVQELSACITLLFLAYLGLTLFYITFSYSAFLTLPDHN